MIKMRCVIIDDDDLSRILLVQTVLKIDVLEIAGEFGSSKSALDFLSVNHVDLIISDVEMPEFSGLELLQMLPSKPKVIFTTAHENYAAKAYDIDVTDYVVKPVTLPRLIKAVQKVQQALFPGTIEETKPETFLFVRKSHALVKVDFSSILWVQADADYMLIETEKERFMHLSTMKAMEDLLPESDFMRIHRSFIIRLDKVSAVEEMSVVINRKSIPVSKTYWEKLKKRLTID